MSFKNFVKFLVVSSVLIQILGVSNGFAINPLDIDDIDTESYVHHYNRLLAVEEADDRLKGSSEFEKYLRIAGEIIIRYGAQEYFGLRLMHRHFPLSPNHIMVEEFQLLSDVPSLVTSAHTFEDARTKGAIPSGWIFGSTLDEINVFETTTDPAVQKGSQFVQEHPEFFDEIGRSLRDSGLNNLVCLGILPRQSLTGNTPLVYLEQNYESTFQSVTQLGEVSDLGKSIKTSWSFAGPIQHGCVPMYQCKYVIGQPHAHIPYHIHS